MQVYRGKLRPEYGSGEVAVKVQRPGVLEAASLDIFLLRRAAGLLAKIPGMSDQWALTLDDWALRFFQVRDYRVVFCIVDWVGWAEAPCGGSVSRGMSVTCPWTSLSCLDTFNL